MWAAIPLSALPSPLRRSGGGCGPSATEPAGLRSWLCGAEFVLHDLVVQAPPQPARLPCPLARPPSPLPTVALASLCPPHHAPCRLPPYTSPSLTSPSLTPPPPSPPPPSPPPPSPPPPSPQPLPTSPPPPLPAMHLAEDALPHRDQDPALRPHLARRDQLDRPQQRGWRQLGRGRRHHGLHLARPPPLWTHAHTHTPHTHPPCPPPSPP